MRHSIQSTTTLISASIFDDYLMVDLINVKNGGKLV